MGAPPAPCRLCAGDGSALSHTGVPLFTQWPSRDLIGKIAYRELDASADPLWRDTGAPSVAAFAEWSFNWCGLVCLQMVLAHRFGRAPRLFELLPDALHHGCYVRIGDAIKGLIYAPFTIYLREAFGLEATVFTEFGRNAVAEHLQAGRLVLLSVHPEIRNPDRPAPGRGGHLVLVTGYDPASDTVAFNNPSGHRDDTRRAVLPYPQLEAFTAYRGVAIHR